MPTRRWPRTAVAGMLLAMSTMDLFLARAASHLAARPPVRVLYTDLDGTLLGPDGSLLRGPDGAPSATAARALTAAADAGLTVVPVSGRQRAQLQGDARLMGLSDGIAEAGSVVIRAGEVRFQWGACPAGLGATPHEALAAVGALDLLLDAYPRDLRLYEPWHRGREGGMLLHGLIDVADANQRLVDAGLAWATVIDNGATGGWPGRTVRAYHLLPHGVGKARAVADDVAERGISPAAAAAIGDSPEDATMAGSVGTYFQVANGSGSGRDDDIVTPGAMGDGFAQAVTALIAAAEERSSR